MRITWYGHACFGIEAEEGSIVIDPYSDNTVPGLPPLKLSADAVLCSHEHSDHNNREGVLLTGKTCKILVSYLDSWHDDEQGAKRGPNRIHLIKAEDMTAAHLGDLGCELTSGDIEQLKNIDILMIPIGGHYTINSMQAHRLIEQLEPRVVFPMHYRGKTASDQIFGYDEISICDDFRKVCFNPVEYETNSIEVNKDTAKQTAFLRLS